MSKRISCLVGCDLDVRMRTKIWLTFLRIRRALCHDFYERGPDTTVISMKLTFEGTKTTSADAQG
jgi:hypothetical protein